jgi:hypothetical protein
MKEIVRHAYSLQAQLESVVDDLPAWGQVLWLGFFTPLYAPLLLAIEFQTLKQLFGGLLLAAFEALIFMLCAYAIWLLGTTVGIAPTSGWSLASKAIALAVLVPVVGYAVYIFCYKLPRELERSSCLESTCDTCK